MSFRNQTLILSDQDDSIHVGRGRDVVFGRDGDDDIRGGSGRDVLLGEVGDDTLEGGKGADLLDGGFGQDVLDGGRGRDRLFGGEGDDILDGGRGDDQLRGGEGADTLTGGRGEDSYLYAFGEGGDTLLDFDIRKDKWGLDAADFGIEGPLEFQNVERAADDDVAAGLEGVEAGANVYVLQGVWNNAGQAAAALSAELDAQDADEGPLFFVYYNVNLDVSRLMFVDDVSFDEATGAINGSLAQISNLGETGQFAPGVDDLDAIADLATFTAENFVFDEIIG
ncbi:MAG: hypothetical protein AAFW46_03420 [Pseudomonadota bacterium]